MSVGTVVPGVPSPAPFACAAAVFDCVTVPFDPGLAMRTETFTLTGDGWFAEAVEDAEPSAAAPAVAVAAFDCDTLPSEPGLSTRTERLRFDGFVCVAAPLACDA
jgi:hypothetical protein